MRIPGLGSYLGQIFTGTNYSDKQSAARRRKVESCVRKRKASQSRSESKPSDFGICWASVKGTTKRRKK